MEEFDVIVFTEECNKERLVRFNNWARSQEVPKGFIWAGLLGLYGFTFVDFGKGFEVLDNNGEDPKTGVVTSVCHGEKAVVYSHARHDLNDGEYVRLKEVEGMSQVNNKPYKIKTLTPQSFEIECDSRNFGTYTRNGVFEQVKVKIPVNFKSLEESLLNPNDKQFPPLENPDQMKFGRPE